MQMPRSTCLRASALLPLLLLTACATVAPPSESTAASASTPAADARPTLLLVSLDGLRPDYLEIRHALTLRPATAEDRDLVILVAAFLGTTRLIDNLHLNLASPT